MALTATATFATFETVVIGVSPDRPGIYLSVVPSMELDNLVDTLCNTLKEERTNFP